MFLTHVSLRMQRVYVCVHECVGKYVSTCVTDSVRVCKMVGEYSKNDMESVKVYRLTVPV